MKLIEADKSDKKSHLDRLLEKGIVMVFVDTRKNGVVVPAHYKGHLQLPLNISYTYQIPDFKVLDDRVEVTLTFSEGEFFCRLPFEALYVYTSQIAGESVVFPDDVPQELIHSMGHYSAPVKKSGERAAKKAEVSPSLSVIKGTSHEPGESKSKNPKKKKNTHLKLVK